ncbi:MAG: hypothetical protein NTV22_05685 [bacterium]|nr:hypothetical protein [bacterium]
MIETVIDDLTIAAEALTDAVRLCRRSSARARKSVDAMRMMQHDLRRHSQTILIKAERIVAPFSLPEAPARPPRANSRAVCHG